MGKGSEEGLITIEIKNSFINAEVSCFSILSLMK